MAKQEITNWIVKNNANIESVFVPFSQSRNKDEKNKTLNYKVTVKKGNRPFLIIDYSMGSAHCISDKVEKLTPYEKRVAIAEECEKGKSPLFGYNRKIAKPDLVDVLYSLSSECDALNYSSFEQWASEFGYDTDSRQAEKIYRACLETALKMRNGFGEKAIAELQEACQDY